MYPGTKNSRASGFVKRKSRCKTILKYGVNVVYRKITDIRRWVLSITCSRREAAFGYTKETEYKSVSVASNTNRNMKITIYVVDVFCMVLNILTAWEHTHTYLSCCESVERILCIHLSILSYYFVKCSFMDTYFRHRHEIKTTYFFITRTRAGEITSQQPGCREALAHTNMARRSLRHMCECARHQPFVVFESAKRVQPWKVSSFWRGGSRSL